jgi:hypothetical protein
VDDAVVTLKDEKDETGMPYWANTWTIYEQENVEGEFVEELGHLEHEDLLIRASYDISGDPLNTYSNKLGAPAQFAACRFLYV